MQIEQFVPWDDDLNEFVFPSHTSIISKQLIIDELKKQGIGEGEVPVEVKKTQKVSLFEEKKDDSMTLRKRIIKKKKDFRSVVLEATFDTGLPDGQKPLKRVKVEALDMDWIFMGDNCKVLLKLLATEANNQVLVKKSIKTIVDLLWKNYQPVIIKYIFMPYLIYLFSITQLCSRLLGPFLELKRKINNFDIDSEFEAKCALETEEDRIE